MKKLSPLLPALFAAATLLVVGCDNADGPALPKDVERPVKTVVVEGPGASGVRQFPGRIDAAQKVDLAFRLAGTITELPVRESDLVEKGSVIARLDATDLKHVLSDREATYTRARADFARAKRLLKENAIARRDYETAEADLKSAQAALARAKQDVAYTTLTAPFGGLVAKRYVSNFQEVQAKEPIVALQDISSLEVKFDVPEAILRSIQEEDEADLDIYAVFEGTGGRKYPLTFKEIATRADAKTQTFEATYTMLSPEGLTVLPGMTVTVEVDLSRYEKTAGAYSLPVSAVVSDDRKNPVVWVVDEATMTVEPRPVRVGMLRGSRIDILEGLSTGDRVVVAGVSFLRAGMKVRLMPDVEQAEQ